MLPLLCNVSTPLLSKTKRECSQQLDLVENSQGNSKRAAMFCASIAGWMLANKISSIALTHDDLP
jgi:hypothetical protein